LQAKAFFEAHPSALQATLDAIRAALKDNPSVTAPSGAKAGVAAGAAGTAVPIAAAPLAPVDPLDEDAAMDYESDDGFERAG
jgi:hypothetical protein